MLKKGFLGLLLLGFLFIGLRGVIGLDRGIFEHIVSYSVYPLLRISRSLAERAHHLRLQRRGVAQLLADYAHVTLERDQLMKELIQLKSFALYMRDSQALKNGMQRYAQDTIYAPILVKNFQGKDFYLVDAGTASGVTQDMIALYNDVLVGKVIEVYPRYSKVLLITDPTAHVSVATDSTGAHAMYVGTHKGGTLKCAEQADTYTAGDLVLSSGVGGLYPRGFGVGRLSADATVEPLIDYRAINGVALVPNTITATSSEHSAPQA